jgi:hypothetical protein
MNESWASDTIPLIKSIHAKRNFFIALILNDDVAFYAYKI